MKRLGFIFSLLLLVVSSVSASITVTDAQKIVKDYVINKAGWKYEEVKIHQAPSLVKKVDIAFGEGFTLSEASWCFMVDPTPNMKWSHTCKYVCVSPTSGNTTVKTKSMFPEDFNKWSLINKSQTLSKSFNTSTHFIMPGLFKNKRTNVVKSNAHAILISGGQNIGGNWQDGWNEISIMYQALTDLHGYKKSNITVLMSDGNDTGNDITVGGVEMSSPTDLDGDKKSDINYACNNDNVKLAFDNLAKKSTNNDDIFVYIVSHGAPDLVALYGPNQLLYAQELSSYLNKLKAKSITVFVSACHSGSFVDDINGANRTIITSTSKDESGYVYSNDCEIGTFWEPFFYGLTGTNLKTNANFYCDANNDGKNDYIESFINGIQNDGHATITRLPNMSHSTPHIWTSKAISQTVKITAGSGRFMSDNTLTANNKITNAHIVYQSSKKVLLKKGFKYTKSGNAKFKGIVGGNCLRALNVTKEDIEDEFFNFEDFNIDESVSDIDDEISEVGGIEVYPNPTDGMLYIRSGSTINKVIVADMTGKVIIDVNGGSDEVELDLSSNAKGIYVLKVVSENDSIVEKIVLE